MGSETVIADEIQITDCDDSDHEESGSEDDGTGTADDGSAGTAGDASNTGVQMPLNTDTTEVLEESENEAETQIPRRCQKVPWTNVEITAVMKHFKGHIAKGSLATKHECQQCKSAEHPVLDRRSAQNIRDFVRNRGISFKKRALDK